MTDNMKKPWMILIPLLLTGCGHKDTIDPGTWNSYRNPVWQTDVQDPSVLLDDGHFYLFSSETSEVLLPMATSDNLTFWEPTGSAVDDANRPDFIDGGTVQSPEIAAVGGKYILYYSLYKSDAASGIGVAVADVPTGPFKDRGALLTALDTGLLSVLDPAFLADDGANYLVFGRSKGIYLQKLSADGLSADGLPVKIASNAFDAPILLKRDGKYFLLLSMGTYTAGANSTCVTVVGRADRPEGPYFDKAGNDLLIGSGGETLVGTGTKFGAPGHGTVVSLPDGSDWMIYNAYDLSDVARGRTLMLDRIIWSSGWPAIRGAISSFCTDAPAL